MGHDTNDYGLGGQRTTCSLGIDWRNQGNHIASFKEVLCSIASGRKIAAHVSAARSFHDCNQRLLIGHLLRQYVHSHERTNPWDFVFPWQAEITHFLEALLSVIASMARLVLVNLYLRD